jgi:hypothetical protein
VKSSPDVIGPGNLTDFIQDETVIQTEVVKGRSPSEQYWNSCGRLSVLVKED